MLSSPEDGSQRSVMGYVVTLVSKPQTKPNFPVPLASHFLKYTLWCISECSRIFGPALLKFADIPLKRIVQHLG